VLFCSVVGKMMRVLVLAAGYGTRLEREIKNDQSGAFLDLVGVSKALVPVGESDVVTIWLNQFLKADIKFGNKFFDIFVLGLFIHIIIFILIFKFLNLNYRKYLSCYK
jgi:hypothetical protein